MQNTTQKIFYNNINLLKYIDKSITFLRIQNYSKGLKYFTKTLEVLIDTTQDILNNANYFNNINVVVDEEYINIILTNLLNAQSNSDYILLSDELEYRWIPFITSLQEIIINKEGTSLFDRTYEKNLELLISKDKKLYKKLKDDEIYSINIDGYEVEFTSCGLTTLAKIQQDKRFYYHSNGNIMHEAALLAREWYSSDKSEYIVFGFGFGYHIAELAEIDESITIHIYENDLNVLRLAFYYSDLRELISSDRIFIHYDLNFKELNKKIKDIDQEASFVMHYPSIKNIMVKPIKQQLEDIFITYSSISNQIDDLKRNFRININNYDFFVDILKNDFKNKSLYIIAAGPSLDNNFGDLKNVSMEDSIILATGTVYKKLINAGINPNFIIITDGTTNVYKQIDGIEHLKIPILFLSTAYYKIAQNYSGKKYIVFQNGFEKAEKYARANNLIMYETGGSVTTTALDIGIKLGCKRIIFLGLDLAYTNDKDHASNTADENVVSSTEFRKVEDINGNIISTGRNLDMYRKWIENRIENITGIEIIDATEGGAKVKGMQIKKLSECI